MGAINVVLADPRRLGKTSVARAALEVCRAADAYTVSVDLFRQPDAVALAESLTMGALANRPTVRQLLARARQDRLGRSLPHLLELSAELCEPSVDLIVLQQQIDTSTAAGRMFFAVIGAVGEFERDLLSEPHPRRAARRARSRPHRRPQI